MSEAKRSGYCDLFASIIYITLLIGIHFIKAMVADKITLLVLSGLSVVIWAALAFSVFYSVWGLLLGSNEGLWNEYSESERKGAENAAKKYLKENNIEPPAWLK